MNVNKMRAMTYNFKCTINANDRAANIPIVRIVWARNPLPHRLINSTRRCCITIIGLARDY